MLIKTNTIHAHRYPSATWSCHWLKSKLKQQIVRKYWKEINVKKHKSFLSGKIFYGRSKNNTSLAPRTTALFETNYRKIDIFPTQVIATYENQ